MRLFSTLTILAICGLVSSSASAFSLTELFEAVGIKSTPLEEKVIDSVNADIKKGDSEAAVKTLFKYHDAKLKEYKKGGKPVHTDPLRFYATHLVQTVEAILHQTDPSDIHTAYDMLMQLHTADREHFFRMGVQVKCT
ncbi:MAG: hypothetical protein AAF226_16095, partial [Verrucomicrobiota bacterium]